MAKKKRSPAAGGTARGGKGRVADVAAHLSKKAALQQGAGTAPEIVVFTKAGGPLTKRISLNGDGSIKSDGSACIMGSGYAQRMRVAGVGHLATLIEDLDFTQAIALGALRAGLPDKVEVVTKDKLNGQDATIARTGSDIVYEKGRPAFILLDYDTKGMPPEVADRLKTLGGFWPALVTVLPALRDAAHLVRRSTSAGLRRADTREELPGSDGLHGYIVAEDGTDAVRFLKALHERCWLQGLGWLVVDAAGRLLERSIVDRTVGAAERLVFEGPPVLEPPLKQDVVSRRPVVIVGEMIDTTAACSSLSLVERQSLRKLIAEAKQRTGPEALRAREAYVADRAHALAARARISEAEAKRVIEQQVRGVLLADVELPLDILDQEEWHGRVITVGDVLDDPANFEGFTLADPIEGTDYGRGKARIMRGTDGMPFIHSFAHGGATYQLRYDARAVKDRIERASDPIAEFARLAPMMVADPIEMKKLIIIANTRAPGIGVKAIGAMVKDACMACERQRAEARRERELAERTDPRPPLRNPADDAPWLPTMTAIDEVLGQSPDGHPPTRDIGGNATQARRIRIPGMHAFGSSDANAEAEGED